MRKPNRLFWFTKGIPMSKLPTVRLTLCALFAALLAICAQLVIPLGPVPLSLALLAVLLCGGLLPAPWAALSVAAYLLLGLCGVPVFAGFRSGPQTLLGLTGGYLLGYLPAAVLTALLGRRGPWWRLPLAMLVGVAACYALGTVWFMVCWTAQKGAGISLSAALSMCVWPFLPGDALKIALAALLVRRLRGPLRLTRK